MRQQQTITYYQRCSVNKITSGLVAVRAKKKKYTYIYIQIYNILNKHAERQLNTHRSIDPNCNLRPFTISQTRPRIS